MGSKMGAADPNYPKIQGLSRLSRLSYGIAAIPAIKFEDQELISFGGLVIVTD